jgi:hypothetical protein
MVYLVTPHHPLLPEGAHVIAMRPMLLRGHGGRSVEPTSVCLLALLPQRA